MSVTLVPPFPLQLVYLSTKSSLINPPKITELTNTEKKNTSHYTILKVKFSILNKIYRFLILTSR